MVSSLLRGVWIGLSIAAPVGPIGILVLRQSMTRGRRAGLASGFGAALADLVYGLLAVAGVRVAAGYGRAVAIAGGLILLVLAWRCWREKPGVDRNADAVPDASDRWSAVDGQTAEVGCDAGAKNAERAAGTRECVGGTATTFLLTLSNPMTILAFAALVASAGADAPLPFVAGVFLGSMLWWTILSTAASSLKGWLGTRPTLLNRVAALTLAAFALWAILTPPKRTPNVNEGTVGKYATPGGQAHTQQRAQ